MTIEQPPQRRQPLTLYDLYMAARFHLLAAATHICLMLVLELPIIRHTFARLAWSLGPWSDLPSPYGDDPALPCPYPLGEVLRILIPFVFFWAVLLTLSHLLLALLLTQAHTRFGWPRYWREVRSRVELWPAWVASARQCWWVWPAGLFIWHLLEGLSSAMSQAGYGVVDTATPYFIAHLAVIVGAVAILTNRQIRAAVIRAVGPDDVRCFGCGYLLRGLRSGRCPECGLDHDSRAVRYGFVWQRSGRWTRTRRTVLILLALILLWAPVWCPSALLALPGEWLVWIPEMFHPPYGLLYRNPNAFPLRTDHAYIIRQGDAVVIVRFVSNQSAAMQIKMAYWRTAETLASEQPPDASFTADLYNQSLTLPIGPYEFHCAPPQARTLYFYRPDDSFAIEGYDPDRLPEALRDLEREQPG